MKTKTFLISFMIIGFFIVLIMFFLFYPPFLLKFQGYTKYVLGVLFSSFFLFVCLKRIKEILELVKRRRDIKKIIKKWYENHPEKYKKIFNVGGGVFRGGKIFGSDFVLEKISPRDVFLETQAETELGFKWINDCIDLIDKNYDLKELLK